jgi:hypothetical protein
MLLAGLHHFPYGYPHFSFPPNESSVESDGLRLTVKGIQQVADGTRFTYVLEWVPIRAGESQLRLMRPLVHFEVLCWGADGRQLLDATDDSDRKGRFMITDFLDLDFACGPPPYLYHASPTVHLPTNAKFIAVRFGSYTTTKVPIPEG